MSDFIIGQKTNRFTFPSIQAQLDKETVEAFDLAEPLKKFGEQLLVQYPEAVGVKFVGLDFVLCLKPQERER